VSVHGDPRAALNGIPRGRLPLHPRVPLGDGQDRYQVKTDKASGIINDPNDASREVGDPGEILDLLARIVTDSLEAVQNVDGVPALAIRTF